MKKLLDNDGIIKHLINQMLEKHGVDYDFVLNNQLIDNIPWYSYYTFTLEEEEEFKEYAVKFIKENMKINKKFAEREFSWFSLMWGLKIKQ